MSVVAPAETRGPAIFDSVDSTPRSFTAAVAPWRAPLLLATFAVIALVQIVLLRHGPLAPWFPNGDYVFGSFGNTHSVGLRNFIVSFYLAFALVWPREPWRKVTVAVDLIVPFFLLCALMDVDVALASRVFGVPADLHVVELLSGIVGFCVFSLRLLEQGAMPEQIRTRQEGRSDLLALAALAGLLILAVLGALVVERFGARQVDVLRHVAVIGGIGPGVFLVMPLLFTALYVVAALGRGPGRRRSFTPNVTVIVPAFNEEHGIARTVEALDAAADGYAGQVTVLIANNNSRDRTGEIAMAAFASCRNVRGILIHEPVAGKSHALNAALAAVKTRFVVRVDADTQVLPGIFAEAMRHFADPRVGVVGGLPVVPWTGLFDGARQLETLVKHGFYSVAFQSVASVVGVPGMFAVYRTRLLRTLGGFVAGMNGEDTDISLRIGELGYRSVVDAKVRYVSEVPVHLKHLREQRLRWYRSVFHVSSRNRGIILGGRAAVRGKVLLPYMLFNSSRRAMMLPLAIFGALELAFGSGPAGLLSWQPIVAAIFGASVFIAVFAALVNRMPGTLVHLPEFLLRAYFSLETLLTVNVVPRRRSFALASSPVNPLRNARNQDAPVRGLYAGGSLQGQ